MKVIFAFAILIATIHGTIDLEWFSEQAKIPPMTKKFYRKDGSVEREEDYLPNKLKPFHISFFDLEGKKRGVFLNEEGLVVLEH